MSMTIVLPVPANTTNQDSVGQMSYEIHLQFL